MLFSQHSNIKLCLGAGSTFRYVTLAENLPLERCIQRISIIHLQNSGIPQNRVWELHCHAFTIMLALATDISSRNMQE
jgi:hypothetical protein